MRRRFTAVALIVALGVAGSGLAGSVRAPAATAAVAHWKAWLCFPGEADDWCSVDLTTTVIPANGSRRNLRVSVPTNPPIDCFYLYPTVSEEAQPNSDLVVRPEERETAITQAARFSHVCRVYAPMYRQVTAYAGSIAPSGKKVPQGNYQLEYDDIRAAWRDYLAHYNDGRGVVLIGHSEGSFLFEQLIANEYPQFKKVMVSAILLGGDVEVDRHNRFDGVPACSSSSQTGCIVAYSSWDHTPPRDAMFQQVSHSSQHVLCVNPAAPAGGSAAITPIFAGISPQGIVPYGSFYVAYHWVEFPGLYTARCVREGSRAWLLVTRRHRAGDHRPTVTEALGPSWGLHAADVNITLANLVSLVASQSRAWLKHR